MVCYQPSPSSKHRSMNSTITNNTLIQRLFVKHKCGYILTFEQVMDLRTAFAGVLRALRLVRGARYADLYDATHRRKIAELENAQTSITLEQFDALAESLGLDAIALMALCVSEREGVVPQERILDSIAKLTDFEAAGGMKLIREQFDATGSLVKRSRGRPLNTENEKAVLALKAEGASPQQAATRLELALTSVLEYWRKA